MTAQGIIISGSLGPVMVAPPALSGSGAPPVNFKGILGQEYFDKSISPPTGYVWNGSSWSTNSGAGVFTSFTAVGTTSINDTGAAATSIGSLGTGTVAIGNPTGGVAVGGAQTVAGNETVNGNVIIAGAAHQLQVHGGAATDFIGTATLVAGTVTIANTNIATTDRIFIQRIASNASTTLGELSYTISAATSFTITSLILGTPGSTQTGDLSSVAYVIVRQVTT